MDTEVCVEDILKQSDKYPLSVLNRFPVITKYLARKDEFEQFKIYDNDTFICTFPKSGTTWTQEMVWLIANNVDFEAAKVDLNLRCTFLEHSLVFNTDDPNKTYPPYITNSVRFCNNLKQPRFIKTHFPFDLLPKQIQNGSKTPKIIYVTRNPKDVCTSFYHHLNLFGKFNENFNEFCDRFLKEQVSFGPYHKHIRSFANNQKDLNILFLKFEDMKKDLGSIIKRVANFLDVQLTNDQIHKLKEHLSFESMKNNSYVNKEQFIDPDREGHFMRSGKVGSYKEEMNGDTEQNFDIWINKNFQGLEDFVYLQ